MGKTIVINVSWVYYSNPTSQSKPLLQYLGLKPKEAPNPYFRSYHFEDFTTPCSKLLLKENGGYNLFTTL